MIAHETNASTAPNVGFVREDVKAKCKEYDLIRDVLGGSTAIKAKKSAYLPIPNEKDASQENAARYHSYLRRAVFYDVTRRTLRGLSGQIFARSPIIELPSGLKPMIDDCNGAGVSFEQLLKKSANDVIPYGRGGLLTDYPKTEGQTTQEQLEAGNIYPTIEHYEPWNIINWRHKKRGSKKIKSLVVLLEEYVTSDDGFEQKKAKEWRVLKLDEADVYRVEFWRQTAQRTYVRNRAYTPVDHTGKPFNEIPFEFIGAENNDAEIDDAPLFGMADLNTAHFRNSADHEENIYVSAQPTLIITGLTEQWADRFFKNGFPLGARASIPLPANAGAEFIQGEAQSGILVEMEHKEKQMIALGAKLVENKEVQRTATEAKQTEAGETSTLAEIAKNVSAAYAASCRHACRFTGDNPGTIKIELNTDFALATLTPEDRAQAIADMQAGIITWEETRAVARRAGVATLPDDEAKVAIKADLAFTNPQPGGKDDLDNTSLEGDE